MGEGRPQQVVKIWKFSSAYVTNEFLVQNYEIALCFICLFLFDVM